MNRILHVRDGASPGHVVSTGGRSPRTTFIPTCTAPTPSYGTCTPDKCLSALNRLRESQSTPPLLRKHSPTPTAANTPIQRTRYPHQVSDHHLLHCLHPPSLICFLRTFPVTISHSKMPNAYTSEALLAGFASRTCRTTKTGVDEARSESVAFDARRPPLHPDAWASSPRQAIKLTAPTNSPRGRSTPGSQYTPSLSGCRQWSERFQSPR